MQRGHDDVSIKDCENWVKRGQLTSILGGYEKDKQCENLTVWAVAWWIDIRGSAARGERERKLE